MKLADALENKKHLEFEAEQIYKWLRRQQEEKMPKNVELVKAIEGVIADIDKQAEDLGKRIEATIEDIELKELT